jgi:hypothetical protein
MIQTQNHLLWTRERMLPSKDGEHKPASSSKQGKSMTATGLSCSLSSASEPEMDPSSFFFVPSCTAPRQH